MPESRGSTFHTARTPKFPDENALFRQGVCRLAALRVQDAIDLSVETSEEPEGSSDPISTGLLQERDLLNAAKHGYVYRARGDGRMTLLKRERSLVLQVRPEYVHCADMVELEQGSFASHPACAGTGSSPSCPATMPICRNRWERIRSTSTCALSCRS